MTILSGHVADVYLCSGAGTGFTNEACSLVTGTTYQITDTSKRIWDHTTAVVVKNGGVDIDPGAYSLVYGTGKIILLAAPAGAVTVTGAYLTASKLAQCTKWSLSAGPNLVDAAVFGDAWESKAALVRKASITVSRFYAGDAFFFGQIGNPMVLVLYEASGGAHYVAVCHMDTDGLTADEGALQAETLNFTATGAIDYVSS